MACPKNRLAQNVCTRIDPFEVCMSRAKLQDLNHVFEHRVETEGKPTTDQKNSGRCWLFAALNCIRIPFIRHYNLDDFEFSQTYMFFWDKIERSNHFLNTIAHLAMAGEPLDSRLMGCKLADPINDGGQWHMFVNLVNKYGLMPKKCFPESFCSSKSIRLNTILKSKLREFAMELRELAQNAVDVSALHQRIVEQMRDVYRVVAICLGIPPQTFTWEYQDKAKKYARIGPVTAQQFYQEHVAKCYNVQDKVCLVTDPRPDNPYERAYTIEWLGNVVGGDGVLYNNQRVELLMGLVMQSIRDGGEAVWFGCDVNKRYSMKAGFEDLLVHDFQTVFGLDVQLGLNKADRLKYGESAMTHAMVFTGVSTNSENQLTKLRVENSWGEDSGDKGYIMMSADWFREFVYEIVVDKKYVSDEVMKVFHMEPIVLPAWDPMGTLAE